MSLEEQIEPITTKVVHTIQPESSVHDAATLMAKEGVGSLMVASLNGAAGIITDRDILMKVTAKGIDPKVARVKGVMSTLVTTSKLSTVGEVARLMAGSSAWRVGVTGDDGQLVGIITATDLVNWMATKEKLSDSLINYLEHETF